MTRRHVFAAATAAAAAAIAVACAPITVTTYTGRDADVAAYRTFAWDRSDGGVPGDPRLDNNDLFHDYVRHAIERQLVSRGYEPTALQPDLYVRYQSSARQQTRVSDSRTAAGRPCDGCSVEVYDIGTLLIDLRDARSGALVWRGVAESTLPDQVNRQDHLEQTVERVVERILAELPRRS